MPIENLLLEKVEQEFRLGYLYLDLKKEKLAKEKIESGINILNNLIPHNYHSHK